MPTYEPASASISVSIASPTHTTSLTLAGPTSIAEEMEYAYESVLMDAVLNAPIAGATVTLQQYEGSSMTWKDVSTAITDATGKATFYVLYQNPIPGIQLRANFVGNTTYLASSSPALSISVTEVVIATALGVAPPTGPLYEDTSYNFTVNLREVETNAGIPGASISLVITVGGAILASYTGVTNDRGLYAFPVTFSEPGSYTMVFTFAGMVVP